MSIFFLCLMTVFFPWMQFLQSHSDVFMLVSNGTRVALKANPPSPVTDAPGPAEQTAQSDPSSPSDPGATEPQQSKREVQGRWQNLLRVHKFKSNPEGLRWAKKSDITLFFLLFPAGDLSLMPFSHSLSSCLSAG